MLMQNFDHTLLLNEYDSFFHTLRRFLESSGDPEEDKYRTAPDFARIVVVPNCGMEGLAKYVACQVATIIDAESFDVTFERNLRVVEVTCWEDSKNRATFRPQ